MYLSYFYVLLRIEPRVLHVLDERSTAEPESQPLISAFETKGCSEGWDCSPIRFPHRPLSPQLLLLPAVPRSFSEKPLCNKCWVGTQNTWRVPKCPKERALSAMTKSESQSEGIIWTPGDPTASTENHGLPATRVVRPYLSPWSLVLDRMSWSDILPICHSHLFPIYLVAPSIDLFFFFGIGD
ncbi:hypothetical protein H1C71_007873 [Ictidomys tridecemlineatus]|nr:hypothetical protein H1C71_007873 [Ictidomys tridecemlineatus]